MFRFLTRKYAVAAAVAGATIAVTQVGTAEAAGHKFCQRYADSAVWQHSRNVDVGCGYGGLRWHHAWRLHYGWCRDVPRWQAKQERKVRRRALRACGGY